jgi:hypothetical protein
MKSASPSRPDFESGAEREARKQKPVHLSSTTPSINRRRLRVFDPIALAFHLIAALPLWC